MGINRRRFCAAIGFGALGTNACLSAQATTLHESTSRAFGTTIRLVVSHASEHAARDAMKAAFAEVSLIENLMSVYQSTSQISQLNEHKRLQPAHPLLLEILHTALRYSRMTAGAFDITVQPLWVLHQATVRNARTPTEAQLGRVRQSIGYGNVEIRGSTVMLHNAAEITLNGIAQGFATDRIKKTLLECGIQHALIDVGEIAGIGSKSAGDPWTVGIQHPRREDAFLSITPIQDRCLATSGDYATAFSTDFLAHHVFDPSTGYSPRELASVSVLAPTATEADALSTALLVMGASRSARLLAEQPSVDALFVTKAGRVSATNQFPAGRAP